MEENLQSSKMISQIRSALNKPVVLVGMMGSGKSHLGRLLAQELELDFYDSDQIIEEKAGRSVAEIFETFGEEKFRQSEKNTILGLIEQGKGVIATGGGAVTNTETLEVIKNSAYSVWIKADIKETLKRLEGNTARPLLQTPDPLATLKELMTTREPLYNQADVTIDASGEPVHATLQRLIKTLHNHLVSG